MEDQTRSSVDSADPLSLRDQIMQELHGEDVFQTHDATGLEVDLAGWGSEHQCFAKLVEEIQPKLVLEVGVWKGGSTQTIAEACRELGHDFAIVCIDTWLGALEFWTTRDDPERFGALQHKSGYPSVYYQFLHNINAIGLAPHVVPFPQTSLIAARWMANKRIEADLIYVDASHDFEDVLADLFSYWPVLRVGGAMFGDDYHDWPFVRKAVDEFARRMSLDLDVDEDGKWVFRKQSASMACSPPVGIVSAFGEDVEVPREAEPRNVEIAPMVSICILSFNRLTDIQRCLEQTEQLDYPPERLEIVVADNGSSDDTVEWLRQNKPEITVVALPDNTGVSAWNHTFMTARGEFLCVLDDDSYITGNVLREAVARMQAEPDLGVLSMNVTNPDTGFDFTQGYPTGNLSFWGCGALIRHSAMKAVGGFDPGIFLYAHELDFAIGIMQEGFKLKYCPDLRAYHLASPANRVHKTRFYHQRRSLHYVLAKHFSGWRMFRVFLTLSRLSLSFGRLKLFPTACKAIISGTWGGWRNKKRARSDIQTVYARNFCEFVTPASKQLSIWRTEGSFFKERSNYYPGFGETKEGA